MGIYEPLHWRRKPERRRKSTGKHFVLSLVLVVLPPWRNLNRAEKKCFVLGDHQLFPFFKYEMLYFYLCVTYLHECMFTGCTHSPGRIFSPPLVTIVPVLTKTKNLSFVSQQHLLSWEHQMDEWQHNTLDAQWSFKGLASTFWLMISFIHYADGLSSLLIQSMHDLRPNWWTAFSAVIPQLAPSHFLSSWLYKITCSTVD